MDFSNVDKRFAQVFDDRRFRSIKQKQRKVKIDRRFHSMFTDDKFKLRSDFDKRGRPIHESSSENLKKYYRLSHKEKKRIKIERQKERDRLSKVLSGKLTEADLEVEKDDESSLKDDESDESDVYSSSDYESDEDLGPDLARGEGNIESSTDEEEEDYSLEPKITHNWSELDADTQRSENVSKRLALCNMNWERIRAVDLFVLFHGFAQDTGHISKVSIYPSEYGRERMAREYVEGPVELKEDDEEDPAGEMFDVEKLRQHQINRLKYYYAVVECDSAETADTIYKECDGLEYELCATRLDLRFIPDDMTFDEQTPKDVADHLPDKDNFKPSLFVTSALKQSKVQLTWDETDHSRLKVTMRKLNEDDLADMDMKDFLASSSGEENEEENANSEPENKSIAPLGLLSKTTDQDQIERYRSLLLGDDDENKPDDVHMEITWEPDLDDNSEEEEDDDKSTDGEEDIDDDSNSGVPSDVEDAETENVQKDVEEKAPKKKRSRRRKKSDDFVEDPKEKAALEMLMMDPEDDGKKHFDMNEILKDQQMSKKKRRKLGKDKVEDDFNIDVDDSRFSAVYSESAFALDPNNPSFRKSKGMKELLNARQNRLHTAIENGSATLVEENSKTQPQDTTNISNQDIDINKLVASIKSKTKNRLSKAKLRR